MYVCMRVHDPHVDPPVPPAPAEEVRLRLMGPGVGGLPSIRGKSASAKHQRLQW